MSGPTEVRTVMTDFEVGVDLDESLFSLDGPEGYTVQERQLERPEKPIVPLANALGLAAELNGGVFPPSLRGEHGIDGLSLRVGVGCQNTQATSKLLENTDFTRASRMNLGRRSVSR